jgi:ATP-dependent helicase HrpA
MEAHVLEIGPKLAPHALAKKQEAIVVLNALAQAHGEISRLKAANEEHLPVAAFLFQRAADLQRLVPPGFMLLYDSGRIAQLSRYLKAVTVRAQRGVENLVRDKAKEQRAAPFEESLKKAVAGLDSKSSEHLRIKLEDLFWLLEEFKVSLFAQELKTAVKVSEKRLAKLCEEIALCV